jgi:hypothetical protein
MDNSFQLAAIAGTLGLLWFALTALRRFRGEQNTSPRVQVRQRVPVSNGCQLLLIEWDGQELLVATGGQPCTVMASKPVAVEARSTWAQ